MPRKFRTSGPDAGQPLGAWLAARLAVDAAEAAALVTRGSVYVDGRRVRAPEAPLAARQTVTVHEAAPVAPFAPRVVHEDAAVLVVDKPAGVPTQAVREAAAGSLEDAVRARWPEARALHRLDREASGLVLFARTREARRRLQADLDAGRIAREYLALVGGRPAWEATTIDAPIGRDPADPRRRRVFGAGAEAARTRVRVVEAGGDATLVRVTLETGRTHQIRVHLAHAGHPIVGDALYGGASGGRLCLHAARLAWPGGVAESPAPFGGSTRQP